jgi:hypothetical protein
MTGRANLRNRHGARSWEFVAYGPPDITVMPLSEIIAAISSPT